MTAGPEVGAGDVMGREVGVGEPPGCRGTDRHGASCTSAAGKNDWNKGGMVGGETSKKSLLTMCYAVESDECLQTSSAAVLQKESGRRELGGGARS